MDDLIRRADAIELCRKWTDKAHEAKDQDGWWMADNLLRHTKEIPSADAVSEWIPCSERLPSEFSDDERVLATTDVDGLGVILMPAYDVKSWYLKGYISAWMPLPKPYGEREDE